MKFEEIIFDYLKNIAQKPMDYNSILSYVQTQEKSVSSENLRATLAGMEAEGTIFHNRKEKYGTLEQFRMVSGVLRKNAKGFGFLEIPDENESDVYISGKDIGNAMNGDLVLVQKKRDALLDANGEVLSRAEGRVVKILQRKTAQIVGKLELTKHFGFVIPDDKKFGSDIFISKNHLLGAQNGMKVLVEILSWPEATKKAEGKIIQVFGKEGAPGVDMLSIIFEHSLPQQFPIAVLDAAERIPEEIPEKEIKRRRDLRQLLMVTIDGDDAKDLDDAVSLEILDNGNYYLGVHIADVGHYVHEDSVLDKEALERATSIYLADRVIPMLPQKLSNGVCSLNEKEDRLALSCFMEIDKTGEVLSHDICETVICVNHRMTYRNVNKMIRDKNEELCEKYSDILPMLQKMAELQMILEEKRKARGAITFDLPESKVILDKHGKAVRIEWRISDIAEKMIEEFMLAANETVSEHYFWLDVPFLYRVHEEPDMEDVLSLNRFLQSMGFSIKGAGNGVHPREYQAIIDEVEGLDAEMIINKMLLRSMQHARYSVEPLGHFGLAATYYSHFTSPIRRYPDLAIHRVIKELIRKDNYMTDSRMDTLWEKMEHYADQSSERERRAEEAERDSVDLKKAEYMKPFVGEIFSGKISGVTNFGIFVQLENSVEGLVHITTLQDDYYVFDDEKLILIGEHTGKQYRIGQLVEVKLTRVSLSERQIDFEVVEKRESFNRKQKSKTRL